MEIEVTPPPGPDERHAILAALARLLAERDGAGPPAWWQAGVPEEEED